MPLRIGGALHALARRGVSQPLTAMYRDLDGDFDPVFAGVLAEHDEAIAAWLNSPPQTNEVGRSAAIWAALLVAAARHGSRFELLELGSSAGLNLNLAHYPYDLGGVLSGDPSSTVRLHPKWTGAAPLRVDVEIVRAHGVDLQPLDASQASTRERLAAYVWPDDRARSARLDRALDLAVQHPPEIDRGNAADWLEEELGRSQQAGVTRAVFHSVVLQYLPLESRSRVVSTIEAAGERATQERPLVWISFEWDAAARWRRCGSGVGRTASMANSRPAKLMRRGSTGPIRRTRLRPLLTQACDRLEARSWTAS